MRSFDLPAGVNFRSGDTLDPASLSKYLKATLQFLREIPSCEPLHEYRDWLEHDGIHFPRGKVTFSKLFDIIATPKSLLQRSTDDFEVRVGVAPADVVWYLRFRVEWDEFESSLEGTYDVTVPEAVAEAYESELVQAGARLIREPAENYYARITC